MLKNKFAQLKISNDDEIIVKISEIQYLEELRRGKIFMRPVGYYRKEEENGNNSKDKNEGVACKNVNFTWESGGITFSIPNISGSFCDEKLISCFMNYSKYIANTTIPKDKLFSQEIIDDFCRDSTKKYGALFFSKKNAEQRLSEFAITHGLRFIYYDVEYLNKFSVKNMQINSQAGNRWKTAFQKEKKFQYQYEYRILLDGKRNDTSTNDTPLSVTVSDFSSNSILYEISMTGRK